MKKQLPLLTEKIISNWLYKLIAFVVALSIWVTTLQGRKDFVRWRSLEVEFIVNPDHVLSPLQDRTLKVQVSGSRMSLNKFTNFPHTLSMNLVNENIGKKRIEIMPSQINLPAGVKLLAIQPKYFDIEINEVKSK